MLNKQMKEHQDNAPMDKNGNLLTPLFKDVVCSYLKGGVSDLKISNISFEGIFNKIVADENVRLNTEEYRRLVASGRTEEAKQKKILQSCFSTAAVFEGGTGKENCVAYTNVALADYDHLSPEEVERCRQLLRNDEHCLMFYKSMGGHGNGFHILVPVMGVCDERTHKLAWQQVNAHYDKLLGLKHDTNCSDVARKSILAHDPQAFMNAEAQPMFIDYTSLVKDRKPGRPLKDVHHTLDEVGKYIDEYMKARNLKYQEGNRNNYIFNAACQLNRYGVDMEEAIEFFNNEAHDLSEDEIRRAVVSAYSRNKNQHGTQSPYKEEERKKQNKTVSIDDVEEYMLTIADYRHNLISQRYEIRWKDETEWKEINDSTFNDIWRKVCKDIKQVNDKMIRNIIESSFSHPFNPFIQSLDSLKPWNGVTDHIGVIADMVHIKPECQNYFSFKDAFKKWLVAAVASICDPQAYNKKILTFVGKQNTYKTTFFSLLHLPSWGNGSVYVKNSYHDFSKDERLTMTKSPIFCLDEISHLSNNIMDELKSLTSQTTINERRAYGRYTESLPRISSFCATSNYISFLTDMTGNNRFLVYEVEGIDCPLDISIEQKEAMWRQAYQLYKSGFQYWFSKDEDSRIDLQNTQYETNSPEEDLINTYYKKPEYGDKYKIVNATNIIEHIGHAYRGILSQSKVNQAMAKLGFTPKRSNKQRGFMVIEIPQSDISLRQQSSDWSHLPPPEDTSQTDTQATLF